MAIRDNLNKAITALKNKGTQTITNGNLVLEDEKSSGYMFKVRRKMTDGVQKAIDLFVSGNGNLLLRFTEDGVVKNSLALKANETTLAKPLTIESGGTGAATAAEAITKLGAAPAEHTHARLENSITKDQIRLAALSNGDGSYINYLRPGKPDKEQNNIFFLGSENYTFFKIYTRGIAAPPEQNLIFSSPIELVEPLAITEGGTGADTAAQARKNLGFKVTRLTNLDARLNASTKTFTFNLNDYDLMYITGRPGENSSICTMVIAKESLTESNQKFQLCDNNHFISFNAKILNGFVTLTFVDSNDNGYLFNVRGFN